LFAGDYQKESVMNQERRLLCILAHPDDESLGMGGILAKYANEDVATYLVTATRGEHGWFGPEDEYPGPAALGQRREQELYAAAAVLGLQEVNFLDYEDGRLDQADPDEVIGKLVDHLRRIRPHVVVTFDPYGAYGHPDHIAICQFTTAAVVAAANDDFGNGRSPHQVSKLYYYAETLDALDIYEEAFGELVMQIDGVERRAPGWPAWAITTRVDTAAYRQQVWQAISCHQSQLPGYQALRDLPREKYLGLWDNQSFYRAFSLVNGGRAEEQDLFAGLHQAVP
jgi:LmbE family N-acetylglucosaminyl deacetylase